MNIHERVVTEARTLVGEPFRHHFKPVNNCEGGLITVDECMERGMDAEGYDCSGLVIVSICRVLDIPTNTWPRELRHTKQLIELASNTLGSPGDIRVYTSQNDRSHLAIAATPETGIHASGVTLSVEEGEVTDKYGPFKRIQSIALDELCELAALHENDYGFSAQ